MQLRSLCDYSPSPRPSRRNRPPRRGPGCRVSSIETRQWIRVGRRWVQRKSRSASSNKQMAGLLPGSSPAAPEVTTAIEKELAPTAPQDGDDRQLASRTDV